MIWTKESLLRSIASAPVVELVPKNTVSGKSSAASALRSLSFSGLSISAFMGDIRQDSPSCDALSSSSSRSSWLPSTYKSVIVNDGRVSCAFLREGLQKLGTSGPFRRFEVNRSLPQPDARLLEQLPVSNITSTTPTTATTTRTSASRPTTNMAISDSHITDPVLLSVLAAASTARAQSLELLDIIAAAKNSSQDTEDAVADSSRKLTARIAQLRGLNRKAIVSVRNTKQETTEARQEIDALHLVLQNLYYEQRHLRGEIRGCEGFEYVFASHLAF